MLLLLGARAGLRHLAHFRMGDNNKPNFPRLTRALVQAILRDAAARLPELLRRADDRHGARRGEGPGRERADAAAERRGAADHGFVRAAAAMRITAYGERLQT